MNMSCKNIKNMSAPIPVSNVALSAAPSALKQASKQPNILNQIKNASNTFKFAAAAATLGLIGGISYYVYNKEPKKEEWSTQKKALVAAGGVLAATLIAYFLHDGFRTSVNGIPAKFSGAKQAAAPAAPRLRQAGPRPVNPNVRNAAPRVAA